MTYEEAQQKALNSRWEVVTCNQGETCWCRMIEAPESLYEDEAFNIIPSGSISKLFAEHIVNLHNESNNSNR